MTMPIADGLTEATPNLHRVLQQIRSPGVRPGVFLNPATPAVAVSEVLSDARLTLVRRAFDMSAQSNARSSRCRGAV
jgi:pentose-5-phosphate-3-epimerase